MYYCAVQAAAKWHFALRGAFYLKRHFWNSWFSGTEKNTKAATDCDLSFDIILGPFIAHVGAALKSPR